MAILNTEEYAYIIPPSAQFNDENGKPYSAGFVEFYKHGTSERYITYADWSGSFNPFRIPLNSQGRAVAIVPKDVFLDMYVYNYLGNLAYSRLNVNYIGEGGFTTDNLVRGIVPESDNVHTRVARTLEDGTQIYGISVDEDLWIAQAIAPNDWTPSQSTPQGVLRWYNKKLYYHITNVNTNVPPDEDAENWKSTTISDFLKSFNIDWGKLVATNTGAHGIGPWTKKSGSVDVLGGYLQLEAERIYHFTLRMEISNETYSENYYTGYITADNDGSSFQPEFELDGSKRNQIAEVSWDGAATEEDLKCYLVLTLPSGFSVTNAVLWLHSINNTILAGNGSIVVDDELSLDSDNPVQNRVVTAALNTKANSADLAPIATSGSWNDLEDVPTDLVEDPNYVHTDENFTSAEKDKLAGIQAGAEANVQADWTQTDTSADDYIKNKPENLVQDANYVHTDNNFTTAEKDKLAGVEAGAEKNVNADWNATSGDAEILNKPENLVQDPNYVHTDNNYTTADKSKLDGVEAGAEVNVQADWSQSDSSADDYIKNKPTIYDPTFVATYNSTTYNDLKAAMDAKQQILLKTSAVATPIVPEMWGYGAGAARVVVLEYSSDSITRKTYSVTTQDVWSSTSEVIHANVDEVLTVIYNTISAETTGKMGSYFQDGKTIFMKIGSSAPFKWLPLYSLASGVYSFRDIQPTQDGKKLQAIDYQWNGTAWSTTTTDLLELKPGTVVLTTSSTTADIEAAIADGAVPLLFVGNATGGIYYQMVVRRVVSTSYCYVFMRDPTEVGTNGSSDYCYVLSNSSSWNPYPDTSGSWAVHNEVYLKSDWDQIDSDSPDYIKNKPNQSPVAAGTDITLTEVNGTLYINSTAVPAHTSAESTKILSVDANGNLVWVSPQSSSQVQADWSQSDSSAVDYIKNKPSIPVIGTITL